MRVSSDLVRRLWSGALRINWQRSKRRGCLGVHGHYFLDDSSDSLVPAGAATIASEILDEVPRPHVIFVPMGDTALIRGVAAEAKRRIQRFASWVCRRSRHRLTHDLATGPGDRD